MVILSIIILCRFIAFYDIDYNEMIKWNSNYSLFPTSSFYQYNNSIMTNIDWIIIYGLLILNIWESLFAFYRYYSTQMTTVSLEIVERSTIFKIFMRYCIIYSLLFFFQIHFVYWLYPVVILLTSIFTLYCTWKTSEILINQFKQMHESLAQLIQNSQQNK